MHTLSVVVVAFVLLSTAQGFNVWPKPSSISQGSDSVGINANTLSLTTNSSSQLLQRAMNRYQKNLLFPMGLGEDSTISTTFISLSINVIFDDEDLQLGVDESYSLNIGAGATSGVINAQSVFGAMRGLETFSQLIDWSDNSTSYSINCLPTSISDVPRFAWRFVFDEYIFIWLDLYR